MSDPIFALSGSTGIIVEADGEKQTVFDTGDASCLMPGRQNGRLGMASIHIDVFDHGDPFPVPVGPEPALPNAMLLADVRYGTRNAGYGEAGGEFTLDITRGVVLAVGGADTVHINAYFRSSVIGEPIRPYIRKRVSATVHWPTSISPKEVRVTLPSVDLLVVDGVPIPSAWMRIPRQATSFLAQTPTPALLPTLLVEFAHTDAAGAIVSFATIDPNENGTIVCHGVEFFRLTSPTPMRVVPIFDLAP